MSGNNNNRFIDISKSPVSDLQTGDKVMYQPPGSTKPSEYWFKLNGGSCYLYEHEDDIGEEGMACFRPSKTSVTPWRRRVDAPPAVAVDAALAAVRASQVLYAATNNNNGAPSSVMSVDYCIARLLEITVREDELARERKEVQRQLVLLLNEKKAPAVELVAEKEKKKEKSKKETTK